MAQISITWRNGAPYAANTTVSGQSAQVITWVPDSTVNVSNITKPANSNNTTEFTQPAKVANSNNWQCTDSLSVDGNFAYTITGTQASGGSPVSHDPQITNTRGGTKD